MRSFAFNLTLSAVGAGLVGLAINLARAVDEQNVLAKVFFMLAAGLLTVGVVNRMLASKRKLKEGASTAARYEVVAEEAMAAIESALTPAKASLDKEISDVTSVLSEMAQKLRDISHRADDYGDEVKTLVERAAAAQATVEVNEVAAQRIAHMLGKATEMTLREEIEKLKIAYNEDIDRLRKSGKREAWITFFAGTVVGLATNILTTIMMS